MIRFRPSDLANDEFSQACRTFVTIGEASENEEFIQSALFKELVKQTEEFDEAQRFDRQSRMGKTKKEADNRRDLYLKGVKDQLNALIAFGGEPADAARQILFLFDRFNVDPNLNYVLQTEALEELFAELSSTRNKALIEIMGDHVVNMFDSLKEAHKDFKSIDNQKIDTISNIMMTSTASDKRTDNILRRVVDVVNAHYDVPGWENLYSDYKQCAAETMNNNRQRKGTSKKKEE